jgi:Tol biopolymer transport system component
MRFVLLAILVLLGALPIACGGSAAEPTSAPTAAATAVASPCLADTATAAASPTSPATASQPAPTAASGQFAFFGAPEGTSPSSVYLAGSDGAGLRPVWGWPTVESYAVYLEWSPDGRQLAFFGHDAGLDAASGGYSALFWLDPDRGETTNLNLSHLRDVGFMWGPPTWSPDARQLYVSLPPPSTVPAGVDPNAIAGILAIPVESSAAPTWLITLQQLDMQTPTLRVSPDGHKIAAIVGEPAQLVVVRVDDPQTRVVVCELPIGGFPVWSPDSRQLAFISLSPDGTGQLWFVNADGTGLSPLTDHQPPDGVAYGGTATDPVWSPDGRQITYTMLHDATPQVYVSAVDGSQTLNLSNDPAWADIGPSWSPDGREIAFVSRPAEAWRAGEEPSIADIRVIMVDGTDLRTAVAGVQGVRFDPFDEETTGLPAWRPSAP